MSDKNGVRNLISMVVTNEQRAKQEIAEQEAFKLSIITLLGELGGMSLTDSSVEFTGQKIILPETFEGRLLEAANYLANLHESLEKHYEYSEVFNYRPFDGAHAFQNVLKNIFGSAGLGKNRPRTFFSPERPPQMLTINTGVNQTTQVPWGQVEFPQLECTFTLAESHDRERGSLFHLGVDAPKKFQKQVKALFEMVKVELAERSIYKGKAINGAKRPEFVDLTKIDPNKVIYSDSVLTQLDANLWSLLRHTEVMRANGIPLKRAVLLEGPYGTGKTLAGTLTAKEAVDNNWTYLLCRTGKDDLYETLNTAQLYAPSVVWFEDIDTLAKGGTDSEIARLLDALDGAQSKGQEVIAGFTTNFVERIQKGVLRPGRIDAIIHIGELDASGLKKLVKSLIKPELLGEINYDALTGAFKGFMPAFVAESINSALRYAIARTHGHPDKIETLDIVEAANALRRQLDLMNGAGEGSNAPTVDSVMKGLVVDVLNHTKTHVFDVDGTERGMQHDPKWVASSEDE